MRLHALDNDTESCAYSNLADITAISSNEIIGVTVHFHELLSRTLWEHTDKKNTHVLVARLLVQIVQQGQPRL